MAEEADPLSATFAALADPTRRAILARLARGEATVTELAAPFDLLSVALSKGLGAPGGSVLAGPRDVIQRAVRYRRMFGGAMRQVGINSVAQARTIELRHPGAWRF